jgi:BlaI family penicillinase repressor
MPVKSREECRKAKSSAFAKSFFEGNRLSAAFTLLDAGKLSDDQIKELENILSRAKKNK